MLALFLGDYVAQWNRSLNILYIIPSTQTKFIESLWGSSLEVMFVFRFDSSYIH